MMNDFHMDETHPVPATRIEAELWQIFARVTGADLNRITLNGESPQEHEFLRALLRCAVRLTLNPRCSPGSTHACPALCLAARNLGEARAELLIHKLRDENKRLLRDIEAAEVVESRRS